MGGKAYISRLYEVDYERGFIRLKNKKCPRCGSIMARHRRPVARWHCGRCSYTEFTRR